MIKQGLRLAAILALTGSVLGVAPTRAVADSDSTTLGGYQGTAGASGLQIDYTPQGALPLPSLVDIGSPDAVATVSSGPVTFAQASVLDIGDLLSNPDALLTLFSSAYPSGTIPAYPYRISANSGYGAPTSESNPAPGLDAQVHAEDGASTARASAPAVDALPIANFGSLSATATSLVNETSVTVHAVSKASGVNVLNMIKVDSIITDLTATSTGGPTKLSGGSNVVGAELAGQKVTIDGTGIHPPKGSNPVAVALITNLNSLMKQAGLTVTVAGPVEDPVNGRLFAGGLRVGFNFTSKSLPLLADLIASLPPLDAPIPGAPGPEDIFAAIEAQNVGGITIGRGEVALAARSGASEDFSDVPVLGSDLTGGGSDLGGLIPSLGGALPPAPVLGTQKPAGATTRTPSPLETGIGGFLLLALLIQPFLGEGLARVSRLVLAAGGAEHCDSEGP